MGSGEMIYRQLRLEDANVLQALAVTTYTNVPHDQSFAVSELEMTPLKTAIH